MGLTCVGVGNERNGLGYHSVPPPIWNPYIPKKPEGFVKALNMEINTPPNDT